MIRRFLDWLDHRTGHRALVRSALDELIPGGARWRYVWGSTLVFTFFLQVVTGFCLWAAYSPSVQNAWASVFYIQQEMPLGQLIRGVHHYSAQAMVILLAIHLLQVILAGAYRAPREINFWLGLILMQLVLALALTGYLLPWDQKGYYATQVATKIVGATPAIGTELQELLQGGREYGQHTLTRFFALHAGLLPTFLVAILCLHLYLFRRHGVTVHNPRPGRDARFWPDQALKDGLACLAVLVGVGLLAWLRPVELSAPTDPAQPFAAARPEWYFLSLYRFLKFEAVERLGLATGAIIIPGAALLVLALFPFIVRVRGGHPFNVLYVSALTVAVLGLTVLAACEDHFDSDHQAALAEARRDAQRARQLAAAGVPVAGAVELLRQDPLTQGPRLFAQHCAACHRYHGHDGRGRTVWTATEDGQAVQAPATAPDLGNLGTREWMHNVVTGFETVFAPLRNAPGYGQEEGIDPENSEMNDWSGDRESLLSEENADNLRALIEFLAAETGRRDVQLDASLVERGRSVALEGSWSGGLQGTSCLECHEGLGEAFDPSSKGNGYPYLARYLSVEWLKDFLSNPGADRHYGEKNQMPAYAETLSPDELDLLARWLAGDYERP